MACRRSQAHTTHPRWATSSWTPGYPSVVSQGSTVSTFVTAKSLTPCATTNKSLALPGPPLEMNNLPRPPSLRSRISRSICGPREPGSKAPRRSGGLPTGEGRSVRTQGGPAWGAAALRPRKTAHTAHWGPARGMSAVLSSNLHEVYGWLEKVHTGCRAAEMGLAARKMGRPPASGAPKTSCTLDWWR